MIAPHRGFATLIRERTVGCARVACCLLLLSLPCLPATAQDVTPPEMTAVELINGVKERELAIQSANMTVICTFGFYSNPRPHRQHFDFAREPHRWAIKWFHAEPVEPPGNYEISRPEGRFTFVHNLPKGYEHCSMSIHDPGELEDPHQPMTLCLRGGGLWYAKTRQYVAAHAERARRAGWEEVGGAQCAVVEFDVPSDDLFSAIHSVKDRALLEEGAILRLYIAPELGYALPRYEQCTIRGDVDMETESSEFTEVAPGLFFPARSESRALQRHPDGRVEPTSFKRIEITEIRQFNEPIADDEFEVLVPAGTTVVDSRSGRRRVKIVADETHKVLNGDDLDQWLHEQVAPEHLAGPPRGPSDWLRMGLVAANALVFLLVMVVFLFKRRARHAAG